MCRRKVFGVQGERTAEGMSGACGLGSWGF